MIDPRTIRFDLNDASADAIFQVGPSAGLFAQWGLEPDGKMKPFDEIVNEYPITSGPYLIGAVDAGRRIDFARRKDYWARDLGI